MGLCAACRSALGGTSGVLRVDENACDWDGASVGLHRSDLGCAAVRRTGPASCIAIVAVLVLYSSSLCSCRKRPLYELGRVGARGSTRPLGHACSCDPCCQRAHHRRILQHDHRGAALSRSWQSGADLRQNVAVFRGPLHADLRVPSGGRVGSVCGLPVLSFALCYGRLARMRQRCFRIAVAQFPALASARV
eukprot:Amastigsp_a871_117.p3 type:complete len:192 gc:universal Amastigsp_a871_117:170-745(+)